jgi:hypothetical protein
MHFDQCRAADALREEEYTAGNPVRHRAVVAAEQRTEIPARPVVSMGNVIANVPYLGQKRAVVPHRADAMVSWIDQVFHALADAWPIIPAYVVFPRSVVDFHSGECRSDRPLAGPLETGRGSIQIRRSTTNFSENDLEVIFDEDSKPKVNDLGD